MTRKELWKKLDGLDIVADLWDYEDEHGAKNKMLATLPDLICELDSTIETIKGTLYPGGRP